MIDIHDELYKDFEAIKQIPIINTMLEVVCRTTGLGFSAIARVTDNRWLACRVRDEVKFGLEEGGELKIETTICNEIRDHHQPVIIDHVDEDEQYKDHHTPKTYGLQSYISYPIFLKSGEFFGTLCAIGTQPANLKNPKVMGTFLMFADLISFHLQSLNLIERSESALLETNRQLIHSRAENLLYQKISDHNLQEPLRKIAMFSDMLVNNTEDTEIKKAKKTAQKVKSLSQEVIGMIQNLSRFSSMSISDDMFTPVDLNQVMDSVCLQLAPEIESRHIEITRSSLPEISGVSEQIGQLFFQIVNYTITFAKNKSNAPLKIYSKEVLAENIMNTLPLGKDFKFCEICIEQTGTGTESYSLDGIFDIFLHSNDEEATDHYSSGLADCRKIVYNHGGVINAKFILNAGVSFSIILPVDYKSKSTLAAEQLSVDA